MYHFVELKKIRHVIEIMLENHTFADLFPGRGAGSGPKGHVTPVAAPPNEGDVQGGIDNSRAAEIVAMDEEKVPRLPSVMSL